MTDPSNEAMNLAGRLRRLEVETHPTAVWFELSQLEAAEAIDSLCNERVAAAVQADRTDKWDFEHVPAEATRQEDIHPPVPKLDDEYWKRYREQLARMLTPHAVAGPTTGDVPERPVAEATANLARQVRALSLLEAAAALNEWRNRGRAAARAELLAEIREWVLNYGTEALEQANKPSYPMTKERWKEAQHFLHGKRHAAADFKARIDALAYKLGGTK